ncbi:bifunctional diguanylate cyclase/phosphodiesterase [Methylobacillus flagellatus]|uniref:putative bifunctional diguanylate cyclase/phosphodiesterase n=1 Tax=Methylobacillus flagellatus TaxID=405 RepID=UPI0028539F70|nr:EAL domain-containing protein [Methylobacillus flagellatus]MDR5172218.1 bifunctional diguanylate cyclase/phosphodiesterase [Methylobacillus flagellatus]
MLQESYDVNLVAISLVVAIFASYTALNLAERINTAKGRAATWWLLGGAATLGIGIWSMHFIGMLAFRLPIPLGYDMGITVFSLALVIVVSGFALYQVIQPALPLKRLLVSAVIMGIGVASMHYVGMAAMLMEPAPVYDPGLFALSVAIAVAASAAAMWIAFRLRQRVPHVLLARALAALVMGVAICGMHYTGMAAADFPVGSVCRAAVEGGSLDHLTIMVVMGTGSVLVIALLISILDARLESKTAQLAKSLEIANQELLHKTLHDNLTSLPNRTLLEDRVNQALHKARREHNSFALMFIDVDGFKTVNDSLGHHVGDSLLVEAAARLRKLLRAQDTVARVGGDEFVVLLEKATPEDAAVVAGKIVLAFRQPFTSGGRTLRVTASIGIAISPDNGQTYRELAINADTAMYHTKRSGRNGYHFFEASMHIDTQGRLDMMLDLGMALDTQQFALVYQPKFDAGREHIVGAEALLRWHHPKLGTVPPDKFISLAEKTGLIVPIGEWVLNEACRQMRAWHDMGCRHWHVAVNLSAVQFSHDRLLEVVKSTLARWSLSAHCLTLEITESTAMHNVKATLDILHALARLGVKISIDDFGTGYSSLLYLKRLPADELKIDRGFISNLGNGEGVDDGAIVSAIIALGHTLNFRVVAEGVETDAQKAFLQGLGCDELQGYGLSRPITAAQMTEQYATERLAS